MTTINKLAPIHPGEVLMEDFIGELGLTQHKVAVAIGVPPRRINEIVHGKRAVTADTAYVYRGILAPLPSSGSICKPSMTWMLPPIRCSRS